MAVFAMLKGGAQSFHPFKERGGGHSQFYPVPKEVGGGGGAKRF